MRQSIAVIRISYFAPILFFYAKALWISDQKNCGALEENAPAAVPDLFWRRGIDRQNAKRLALSKPLSLHCAYFQAPFPHILVDACIAAGALGVALTGAGL